jgi:hypothetical protein
MTPEHCLECRDKEQENSRLRRLLVTQDRKLSAIEHRLRGTLKANRDLQQDLDHVRLKYMTDEERSKFHDERIAFLEAQYPDHGDMD